jgi:hypothetical protein
MNKIEYLTNAVAARSEEIERFGLDIATNQRVIDSIGDDSTMQDYKAHMSRTVAFSQLEQRKAELHKTALEAELVIAQAAQ